MSGNRLTDLAREYHRETAHSPHSVRSSGHSLDWSIKPAPFKIYPELPVVRLPRELPALAGDTLAALSGGLAERHPLDLERLAGLLFFSAGVTKNRTYPGGGQVYFRAAPSTGALYQTEVYVVTGAVTGLSAGVYHFSPGDFALRCLREGDFRGAVALAAADEGVARQPATLILSAIHWRNTWKYQARGYRHLFWDSGSMLAHVLASAAGLGLPARIVTGFADVDLNALLGLDAAKEAVLELVPVGEDGPPAPPPPVISPIEHAVLPLSTHEVDYRRLAQAYVESSLDDEAEVTEWHEGGSSRPPPAAPADLVPLLSPEVVSGRALGETILARGSTREFSGAAIGRAELSTALYHATRGFSADVPPGLVDLYVNVHAVDGLPAGAYMYHPAAHALELVKAGDFRADSAFLCLEQPLGGLSSATVFFLTDLRWALERYGNRGYRLANLEAGLIGGRLYLGAYAQRFGASGLTFYDGAVVAFFSPHAAGKDAVFVTALGRSVKGPARSAAPLRMEPKGSAPLRTGAEGTLRGGLEEGR